MKKLFLFISLLFFSFSFYAQEVLSSTNSSWQKVIPGELICEPQVTSYGFAIITDSKYLSAFSSNGNLLWDRPLQKANKPVFSVLPGDFFAVITNSGKQLTLVNPSGREIWSCQVDNPIINKPFAGRDGRFYVNSKNTISCYSVNGIRKWKLDVPLLSDLPFQELPDGSFVVFLNNPVNNKTKGLRISPFGTIIEEIVFSGIATSAVSCPLGILISFTNGLSGLFSLEENKAKNKWILTNKNLNQTFNDKFVLSINQKDVIFIRKESSCISVNFVDLEDGKINKSFEVPNITKISECIYNKQGIFITDTNSAYFYDLDGNQIWYAKFPAKTNRFSWTYYFYTNENYLIIFDSNWTLNAYRTTQNLSKEQIKTEKKTYNNLYNIDTTSFNVEFMPDKLPSEYTNDAFLETLKKGDYGESESEWLSFLISAMIKRQDDLGNIQNLYKKETSVFQKDLPGYQYLVNQMFLYGTDTFEKYIIFLLNNEKDKTSIQAILSGLMINGYDPDGTIINALYGFSRKVSSKEDAIILKICDAVYSICLFNGRPAFYAKGKEILKTFLYPSYNQKTKEYARVIFKKISDLGI